MFKVNDRVRIVKFPIGAELNQKSGTILGTYSNDVTVSFEIVGLDEPLSEDGSRAVVIISSCLERINGNQ